VFLFQVIFFAIVHAEKLGHYGRVLKLSQNLVESSSSGSSTGNGKVRILPKYLPRISLKYSKETHYYSM
jgi:hypothetical protein